MKNAKYKKTLTLWHSGFQMRILARVTVIQDFSPATFFHTSKRFGIFWALFFQICFNMVYVTLTTYDFIPNEWRVRYMRPHESCYQGCLPDKVVWSSTSCRRLADTQIQSSSSFWSCSRLHSRSKSHHRIESSTKNNNTKTKTKKKKKKAPPPKNTPPPKKKK